jgi:mandelate racemase
MSPTIGSVRARAVSVPLKRPLATGSGSIASVPLVLADIDTDAGITGHSYIFVITPLAARATARLIEETACLIAGMPLEPLAAEAVMNKRMRLLGVLGLVQYAIGAIDMALWDAFAKSRGEPLVRTLGGAARPIPAYDSRGLGLQGKDKVIAQAEEMLAESGLPAAKLRLGYTTAAEDLAVAQALRRALPANIALMSDYNQCLLPADAVQRARALDDLGLTWIEEPIDAHDFAGNALVARETRTPIQIGENFEGSADMARALAAGACDLAMPDLMRIGGVSGWLRAAAIAHGAGMPMSTHLFPEFSVHLMCVTPTAHWLEYVDWADPILADPVKLRDGCAIVPDRPGAGIEWNEAAVARCLI